MNFKDEVIALIRSGVMPALGCTEPGAVALAAAYAGKELGLESVSRIEVTVDPNVYKNGVAVGVPGTGKVGLGIAAALGALIREPALELSVLSHITPALLVEAGILMDEGRVSISINDSQGLYVAVTVFSERSKVTAIIEGSHTNLVSLTHDDDSPAPNHTAIKPQKTSFLHSSDATLAELIDVVEASPAQDFQFFEESIKMNAAAAQAGLDQRLGMAIGATFMDLIAENILSDDLINHAKILTASAADARMSGENIPVMSVAGSGNHGLTAILPVVAVAERLQISRERLLKALAISTLTTIYIKRYTGNLSALCGCAVAAATGACAAIVWMLDGTREQIAAAIKNMIANLTGMICDGGKVGCALKLSAAAGVAVETALLTLKNVLVPDTNGIIFNSADDTIRNLGRVSNPGMLETDKEIIKIMQEKDKQRA